MDGPVRRSAGLPLSVGGASMGIRLLIAAIFAMTSAACIGAGLLISAAIILRVFAVVLIIPLGLIGILAAAFIVAPRSRFGVWLDHFVPRLREPRVALATAAVLWLIAYLVTAAV